MEKFVLKSLDKIIVRIKKFEDSLKTLKKAYRNLRELQRF
jgi:hypothetical protein